MIFTKKDLEFLNLYSLCVDQKSEIGKSFQIKKEGDNIRFCQVTDSVVLFTNLKDIKQGENFCFNYPTNSIIQLVNTCGDNEQIEFIKNTVKIGKNSNYSFEEIDYDISSMENLFNQVYDKTNIVIKDLEKTNVIKSYTSNEKGLDIIALINNYFVASNRSDVTGTIKTSNKYDNTFFLSKLTVNIINTFKLKEIAIMDIGDNYVFKIDNTTVIVQKQECIIPNIFEDKWKKYYLFDDKIIVNKNDLLLALNRINIISKENVNTRIFFTCKENEIIIESKDKGFAAEKVNAKIDKNLIDHYIIVSSNYLINSIGLIESDEVIIKMQPDKNANTISIWQQNEERFFIHTLLPYID
jgi:hypothetical protein